MDRSDDVNITTPGFFASGDPLSILAKWRQHDPMHWTEGALARGFWSVTRHGDAMQVFMNDNKTFSIQRYGASLPQNAEMDDVEKSEFMRLIRSGANLSVMDGEPHVIMRKAFNDRFRKMNDGKVPSDYGAMGYTGVKVVLEGAKAAGSLDPEKVIPAIEALKYDYYKGPEYYRKCDHQAVQSVLIIESKSKPEKGPSDVFNVIATDEPSEKNLRTCAELGFKS